MNTLNINYDFFCAKFNRSVDTSLPEGYFGSHHHADYELLFVVKGSGTFLIEDSSFEFTDGALFLIPPGIYHVLQTPPQGGYDRFVINFSSELIPSSVTISNFFHKHADSATWSLFMKFYEYTERFGKDKLETLFSSFLSEILVLVTTDGALEGSEGAGLPDSVGRAIDFICSNLDKPLDLEFIASELFLSKSYLSHVFSDTMNTGIMQYVRIKKMHAARAQLLSGVPAVRVSELLGYDNYSTFLRNFRDEFGFNPSQLLKDGRHCVQSPDSPHINRSIKDKGR